MNEETEMTEHCVVCGNKNLTPIYYADESNSINPLKDSITFENDLISPIDVSWDAE